jgi:hypothetical protein
MTSDEIPTKKQLADELAKFARRGIGRSLAGKKSESDVQALSDLSRELAENPSEDWPLRIAKVVIPEVKAIGAPERLAIADVLGIDLERPLEAIEAGESVEPLEGHGGRYDRATERLDLKSVKHFRDNRKIPELERVGQRLVERLEEHRQESANNSHSAEPQASFEETEPQTANKSERDEDRPPLLLIGAVGSLLLVVGVAWLLAVATGVIG